MLYLDPHSRQPLWRKINNLLCLNVFDLWLYTSNNIKYQSKLYFSKYEKYRINHLSYAILLIEWCTLLHLGVRHEAGTSTVFICRLSNFLVGGNSHNIIYWSKTEFMAWELKRFRHVNIYFLKPDNFTFRSMTWNSWLW